MTEELERRVRGFLGLCMRAGQVRSGQEACVSDIRSGAAKVALMDAGAGENTLKRVRDACASHGVKLVEMSAGTLGLCVGKPDRMVVTLGEGSMAERLLQMLQGE